MINKFINWVARRSTFGWFFSTFVIGLAGALIVDQIFPLLGIPSSEGFQRYTKSWSVSLVLFWPFLARRVGIPMSPFRKKDK